MTVLFALTMGCVSGSPVPGAQAGAAHATAKAAPAWEPGDEIPGWEAYDYDCPYYAGADVATVHFVDIWMGLFYIGTSARYPDGAISEAAVVVADCTDFKCETTTGLDSGSVQVYTSASDYPVASVYEKSGYYGNSARPASEIGGNARLPIGNYIADGTEGRYLHLAFCLSRVRPDELSGMIYVTYLDDTLPHDYFQDALVQYPFDLIYEDHAAWDYDYSGSLPSDLYQRSIGYYGDIDYDNAWDWDAITDPDIRAAVYDRYTPANVP